LIAVLRLAIAVLTQKNADRRSLQGRLLPVSVTLCTRFAWASAKLVKARNPSVWISAPAAM